MRRKVVIANWKMNKTPDEAVLYIKELSGLLGDEDVDVVVCAPAVDLIPVVQEATGTNIGVGAQNIHFEESGEFTGEISANMLNSIGVSYTIIGHSERRKYNNETDESVNKKLKKAIEHKIRPILCVGETLEQREQGITREWVLNQVDRAFDGIERDDAKNIIIAYEPIWAIGTGKVPTPEEADEVAGWIREKVRELYDEDVSENIIIQYGGSVKPNNVNGFFNMINIDGALVGGASLTPDIFIKIIRYNKEAENV